MMEQSISPAPMEGFAPLDGETFRRVWGRVMPDQSLSPVSLLPEERATAAAPPMPPDHSQYIPQVEGLMDGVRQWMAQLQRLNQGGCGHLGRQLTALAQVEQSQLRQLGTLYFLFTGNHYLPRAPLLHSPLHLSPCLREGFLQQSAWSQRCGQLASHCHHQGMHGILEDIIATTASQQRAIAQLLGELEGQRQRRGGSAH